MSPGAETLRKGNQQFAKSVFVRNFSTGRLGTTITRPVGLAGTRRGGSWCATSFYRASLSRLIDRYELAFRASHTEAECAALVSQRGIGSLSDYFNQLTSVWRRLAYGHQSPPVETVEALCKAWRQELANEPR